MSSHATRGTIKLTVAGALLVGVIGGAGAAPVNRTAAIDTFSGVDEIVFACTSSTTFVNMSGMSRTFTLGPGGNEEAAILFEASASLDGAEQFDTGFVRLTIDGVAQGPADGTIPLIAVGERGTHGFNWQSKPLTAGSHTARVQWRTDLGSSFCVDARSLIVLPR